MNAREMFEELGYFQISNDSLSIQYDKDLNNDNYIQIEFDKNWKSFAKYRKHHEIIRELHITLQEFKAIQQQIIELGWEVK